MVNTKQTLMRIIGKMTSKDIQVLSISKGVPLCRMSIVSRGHKYNCLLIGHNAFQALYDIRQGDTLQIIGKMNTHHQLIVSNYRIIKSTYPKPKSFV